MRIRDVGLRELNSLVNEDDVLPYVNPEADFLDMAGVLNRPGVMAKGCEAVHGAVLMIPFPNAALEVHWFMPGHGGMKAIRAIVDWIFERTGTDYIFGPCPRQNLQARTVNTWLGGKIIGEHVDQFGRPVVTYAMSREEWASGKAKRAGLTSAAAAL